MSRLDNLLTRAVRAADRLDSNFRDGWRRDCTDTDLRSLVYVLKAAEEDGTSADANPFMALLRARIDARRRLGLPHVDCTARKPGDCCCLTATLTEYQFLAGPELAKVTKAEVLAQSSRHHSEHSKRHKPKPKPKPATPRPLAQMPAEAAHMAPELPPQSPEAPPPSPPPRPRSRPVERTPKWFDEDERGSIIDRIF